MKTISTQPAKATCSIMTVSITLIIAIIFLSSCTASASSRHHNFVPGSSKSIEYHYFPDADVYYDSTRPVYHYSHRQHGWQSAKELPHSINISKHRRHLVHAKQHKPWKNKHQQKKHKRRYSGYFEKSHKGRSSNGKLFPVPQRKDSHRHGKNKHKSSHPADKHLHKKHRVNDLWLHNNQRRAYGDSQQINNAARKVFKKKDNYRMAPSGKQAGQKKQRLQKRARRKDVSQQDKNTHARNNMNLRQEERKR